MTEKCQARIVVVDDELDMPARLGDVVWAVNGVSRRRFLQVGAWLGLAAWGTGPAWALQQVSLNNPLRLGCDEALVQSGLAAAWQRGFAADTGVVVTPVAETVTRVLQMLESGEFVMSLTNAPELEMPLEKQGLAHERMQVGLGGFVVVGPAAVAKAVRPASAGRKAPASPALGVGPLLQALARSELPFLTRGDDSATHRFEQGLWRLAQVVPTAPWYQKAQADTPVWQQAKEAGACTVVERGVWERLGRSSGLALLLEGGDELRVPLHLMRSFRASHPAARLFAQWVGGPGGRRVVGKHPGYAAVTVS